MLSLRSPSVVLLSIFVVRFCDNCVSLKIHDTGVCETYSIQSDHRRIPPKFPLLVCCEQYEYDADLDQCMPICNLGCRNGQCILPNICKCNDGYKTDPSNKFNCIPICEPECVNGYCAAPNKCNCNVGYEKTETNSVCKPSCVGCEFGVCIEPNNCSCFEGYERTNLTCKPKCSSCLDGECVAPETCRPATDYKQTEFPYTTCSPLCFNGNCQTPSRCICNKGYDLICSVVCNHGFCTPPGNCSCKPKKKGLLHLDTRDRGQPSTVLFNI